MKLEYEQLKTEKLQNSYNALMGQIQPTFLLQLLKWIERLDTERRKTTDVGLSG